MAAYRETSYRRRGRGRFLALVILLCAASLLIKSRVFTLKEIVIEGNERFSDAEIAAISGLVLGEDTLKIEKTRVSGNFSRSNYVELDSVEILYPDRVLLRVRERCPCATVSCAGVILVIDDEGVILERRSTMPEEALLTVSMDVSLGAQGRVIEAAKASQREDMTRILEALEAQNMTELISEVNVRDGFNLYLVSRTGVQIILGDSNDLSEKLVWARRVLEKLTEQGVMSGVMDVSTGKNAVYADR